jgi:hypothetical protein
MLPQDLLRAIHTAAVNAGLDRDVLLAGIEPRGLVASLPGGTSPADQLWLDLQELRRVGALADGSVPLRTWLETALHLAAARREAQTFSRALDALPRAPAPASPARAVRDAPSAGPLTAFVSYAPQDDALREELRAHLAVLERQGLVRAWHDGKIVAGQDRSDAVLAQLEQAQVILLLLSASFMASDFCSGVEVKRAMERHARGEAVVIPIIVRPCDLEGVPFMRLQALPRDAKPVTRWSNRDDAWTDVVKGIRRAVELRNAGAPPAR